jgi:hypothetical protein
MSLGSAPGFVKPKKTALKARFTFGANSIIIHAMPQSAPLALNMRSCNRICLRPFSLLAFQLSSFPAKTRFLRDN